FCLTGLDASTQSQEEWSEARERERVAAPSTSSRRRESNSRPWRPNRARLAEELDRRELSLPVRRRPDWPARQELAETLARCSEALSAEASARGAAESLRRALASLRARLSTPILAGGVHDLAGCSARSQPRPLREELAELTAQPIGEPHLQPGCWTCRRSCTGSGAGGCSGPLFVFAMPELMKTTASRMRRLLKRWPPTALARTGPTFALALAREWRRRSQLRAELRDMSARQSEDCQALEEAHRCRSRAEGSGTRTTCELQGRISDLITARQSERDSSALATPNRQPSGWPKSKRRESTAAPRGRRSAPQQPSAPSSKQAERERAESARHETVAALREEARAKGARRWRMMEERINKMSRQSRELQDQLEQQRQARGGRSCPRQRRPGAPPGRGGAAGAPPPPSSRRSCSGPLAASQQENSALKQGLSGSAQGELEATRRRVRELTVQLEEARTAARSATAANETRRRRAAAATTAAQAEAADWRARFEPSRRARPRRGSRGSPIEGGGGGGGGGRRRSGIGRSRGIEAELSAAGQAVRGERHADVMRAHQKERRCRAELSAESKRLNGCDPPGPIRNATDFLGQSAIKCPRSRTLRQRVAPTPPSLKPNLDMERTAHRETLDSLELSEQTYTAAYSGPYQQPGPGPSAKGLQGAWLHAHLPRDERQKLAREREETVAAAAEPSTATRNLRTRNGGDSASARKSEPPHQRRAQPGETAQHGHQAEENLSHGAAAEQQSEEKRQGEFHCPPEDIFGKEEARKRTIREKLRRKDYEIKTLKAELISKEKNLSSASERLANLESTLGLPHESELAGDAN
uniref:RING-type domain-containing protein n=1 Tax=Macrostomum lignano TaxID=282301 RepID=A0A1I8FQY3_9PLAT